ncbi:MAG TPA: zf-HC2 domain-containing protein [Gemmatimonadota bacterium]|nr:zf-HC2 domain-containing protein [Gemmatimonadota bacterium]
MTGPAVCDQIADQLPEFLAGRLPEEDELRVRKHLESCTECRNRANAVSLLQQTPIPQPDPNRWDGFVGGVVAEHDRRHRVGRALRIGLAVAAILIVAAALIYLAAF